MAATDKQYLQAWEQFRDNINKATPIDLDETPADKKKRIKRLEGNFEEWCAFYFPTFYTAKPAPFHIAASKRILNNPEWYEVRSWSRELAKSARTMMEVLYLILTGQKHNVLLVSNSYDNAERLLLPYKVTLEANNRIINDYGVQQSLGNWEAGEFKTKQGKSFRALGAGQSPRGTRNDAIRPDVILIDDIDTDQDVKNSDIIVTRVSWIESALIPTRSISSPLLIIACGNIIAEYCCITEMGDKADIWEVINIRDEHGSSTWPTKNTEEMIDRVLSTISYNAQQREYYNNPIIEGETFERVLYGKVPPIASCETVISYFDPSTSNKDKPKGKIRGKGKASSASFKGGIIVGYKARKYYVYWIRLRQTNNKTFVKWLFEADEFLSDNQVDPKLIWVENNSLQDPHYQQVILPEIAKQAEDSGEDYPPVREDKRKKPEKFDRIEGTLQPEDQNGNLVFDVRLKSNPDMKTMEGQMLSVSPNAKMIDGPDMYEGAVWLIKNRKHRKKTKHRSGARESRKY